MHRPCIFGLALVTLSAAIACRGAAQGPSPSAPVPASSPSVLTNEDIVKMVKANLGDAVIIAKINASPTRFDTSPDTLIRLKEAGVSAAVLATMAQASSPTRSAAAVPADPNDPLSPHEPWIWMMQDDRHRKRMVQLEPTAYSQVKMGMPIRVLVPGGPKSKWKAVVRGGRARLRTSETRPTFYFYFDRSSPPNQASPAQASPGPTSPKVAAPVGISGPNQFTLARFEAKPDERELVIGEVGGLGGGMTMGVPSKDVVEFDFEKLAPGIYKVTPRVDLEPGEYCFLPTIAGAMAGGQLFDFGVNPGQ